MAKIVHYTITVETEDSTHPDVLAEELMMNFFDPMGKDGLQGVLLGVKSEDWNKK